MKPSDEQVPPELLFDDELDNLIREALLEDVGDFQPSPLVWARIRAEVEADRVPAWVTTWRRLQIAFNHTLPRLIPQTIIITLFLLLGGLSLRGYGWFNDLMLTSKNGIATDQRQIVIAERRFYGQYRTEYYLVPVDAPPKGVQRAPRAPAPPTGPQHLVGAMNPS